jgi:hypothetical protein
MAGKAGVSTKPRHRTATKNRVISKRGLERARKRRELNHENMQEALQAASEAGVELGPHPGSIYDVMERTLQRTHTLWLFAAAQVDKLDPDLPPNSKRDSKSLWWQSYDRQGNLIITPSKWPALEATLRTELFEQAVRMGALDIDSKKLQVQTQILDLLGRALSNAAAKAKLPEAQRRALGAALREELEPFSANAPDTIDVDANAKEAA